MIVDRVRKYLLSKTVSLALDEENEERESGARDSSRSEGDRDTRAFLDAEIANLDSAYSHKVLYIMGKEQLKIKNDTARVRKVLLHIFLWIRDNTRNKKVE